jgi:dimeric dUTPase (all-alpha-NTP-PPase superfamily)
MGWCFFGFADMEFLDLYFSEVYGGRMPENDRLEEIFRLQKELNLRVGVDTDNLDDEGRQKWLLNYCRAMNQEIAELTDSVPWKWWAKYQKFDKQNVRVEIVDMLHFLVSLAQVAELGPTEVFEAYTKKHQVNVARQDAGYTFKDESDSKHI